MSHPFTTSRAKLEFWEETGEEKLWRCTAVNHFQLTLLISQRNDASSDVWQQFSFPPDVKDRWLDDPFLWVQLNSNKYLGPPWFSSFNQDLQYIQLFTMLWKLLNFKAVNAHAALLQRQEQLISRLLQTGFLQHQRPAVFRSSRLSHIYMVVKEFFFPASIWLFISHQTSE